MQENKIIDFPGQLFTYTQDLINFVGFTSNYMWSGIGILFIVLLCFMTYEFHRKYSTGFTGSIPFIHSSLFFLLIISSGLIILRIPILGVTELNIDESEWITGAATLIKDFRFWHSVNGMTSGPLNIFPLCLINIAGMGLNYATVRLFALIFIILPSLILVFKSLKILFSEIIARIIIIPAFIFFAYPLQKDILAFNSEHIPMLLTSLALFFLIKGSPLSENKIIYKNKNLYLFLSGIIIALMPYSKLQVVPVAFAFFVITVSMIFIYKVNIGKKLSFFFAGLVFPNLILLVYLYSFNLFDEFWNYFVVNNYDYSVNGLVNNSPDFLRQKFRTQTNWFYKSLYIIYAVILCKEIFLFVLSLLSVFLFAFINLFKRYKTVSAKNKSLLVFSLLLLLSAYFGVIKPGNVFIHYFILLVVPIMFLSGVLLGIALEESHIKIHRAYLKNYLVLFAVLPVLILTLNGNYYINSILAKNSMAVISPVSVFIKNYSHPNERLAVWGYENRYYVETGLLQGTRETHSYLQIAPCEQHDFFIQKFCEDLGTNKPQIFIDVVSLNSFFFDYIKQRYENYPAVKEIVERDYEFIDSIDNARIYKRKK